MNAVDSLALLTLQRRKQIVKHIRCHVEVSLPFIFLLGLRVLHRVKSAFTFARGRGFSKGRTSGAPRNESFHAAEYSAEENSARYAFCRIYVAALSDGARLCRKIYASALHFGLVDRKLW